MYGPPGTGKSGIVQLICNAILEKDGIAFLVNDPHIFQKYLPTISSVETNRKIVVILEDLDYLCDSYETELLELLDGITNPHPGIVYLATTNFLNEIPARVYRPSRFDLLLEVNPPSRAIRLEYVKELCQRFEVDYLFPRKDIVDMSEGLSFAHIKELLISCILFEKPVKEVAERMRQHSVLEEKEDG